jgi:inner membrane protein
MTGRTHDLAAFTALVVVLLCLPHFPVMSLPTAITAFGANFVGGLFPDIDQPTSDLWDNFRLGPYVGKVVCKFLGGHRHISHSLIGLGLIGFSSKLFLQLLSPIILIDMKPVWYSFMIGVISHLIMDLPTKEGLPLLWPLRWKFGIPPLRLLRMESGKFMEKVVVFPILLLITGYLLYSHQIQFVEFFHQYIK